MDKVLFMHAVNVERIEDNPSIIVEEMETEDSTHFWL